MRTRNLCYNVLMRDFNVVDVGKRVREKREEHGMGREKLARELVITGRHLYDIENGIQVMSAEILHNICEILDVSADSILGRESPPPVSSFNNSLFKVLGR